MLLLPALLGAAILLYATSVYGAGVDRDSVSYVDAGRNLLIHQALVITFAAGPPQPLNHFPPLYPALLAPLHLSGAGIAYSVRILNAVLLALYIIAIQLLVLRATDGSIGAALLAGLYVALSTATLSVYARAWSETLFLVLFLYGMLLLRRYLQTSGMASLLLAAVLFALAWLARYVGVTLVVSGGLAILLWTGSPIRRRVRDAVLFGLIAVAPMGGFLLRNVLATDDIVDRALAFHPVPVAWWRTGVDTLNAWLLPVASPAPIKTVAAVAVVAVSLLALYFVIQDSRRGRASHVGGAHRWIVPAVLLLFSAVYLGFFYAVVTFADTGDLSMRTLSPVYSALVAAATYAGYAAVQRYGASRPALAAGVILILCAGLLAVQLLRSVTWARSARADGFDYSGRVWMTAPAVYHLQNLPPSTPLYSNLPELVYFVTGRQVHPLALASCDGGCGMLEADLLAIPAAQRDTTVIVWVAGEGNAECIACLLAAAPAHGFAPAFQDDHFQLFVPASAE